MSNGVEKWLDANAPGDVRAFVNANQLRLAAQAETIAGLRRDLASLTEILGPKMKHAIDIADKRKYEPWQQAAVSMTIAEASEVQKLLTADEAGEGKGSDAIR